MSAPAASASGFAVFKNRGFSLFQLGRLVTFIGAEVQKVAVGYHVYAITGQPIYLGYVGLAAFLPAIVFSLPAGQLADHVSRKRILQFCQVALALGSVALAIIARQDHPSVWAMMGVLLWCGTASTFYSPASQALMPSLVPAADFPRAVTWNSTIWQATAIGGPVLGGIIYDRFGASGAYVVDVVMLACAGGLTLLLPNPALTHDREPATWHAALAGLRYVWERKVLFGTITLDLFAVLLGGAVALMPVFAKDVLHTDTMGFGILRAAPAAGAAVMAIALGFLPPMRRAGALMLGSVGVFGLATIGFGLSTSFWFSVACLVTLGAADMISVVVRHTLVQMLTPESMRGRVSAVNILFIRASNELGEFESGVTAQWFGAVRAVIIGGIGTVVVAAFYTARFAGIRKFDHLIGHPEPDPPSDNPSEGTHAR